MINAINIKISNPKTKVNTLKWTVHIGTELAQLT